MIKQLTGAAPVTIEGVTFRCWRTGILQTAWRTGILQTAWYSEAETMLVRPNPIRRGTRASRTYTAIVLNVVVGQRYTTKENAMRACVLFMRKMRADR